MAVIEMEKALPHLEIHFDAYFEAIQACKEALAERQPNAEQTTTNGMVNDNKTQEPVTHVIGLDNDGKEVVVKLQKPLYTTPPSREWVGLSEEELEQAFVRNLSDYEFARAIEAKVREKNG